MTSCVQTSCFPFVLHDSIRFRSVKRNPILLYTYKRFLALIFLNTICQEKIAIKRKENYEFFLL